MTKLPTLAATLANQDTRFAEVLRLSLVEGLAMRAIARRLKLSRKTVRRMLPITLSSSSAQDLGGRGAPVTAAGIRPAARRGTRRLRPASSGA